MTDTQDLTPLFPDDDLFPAEDLYPAEDVYPGGGPGLVPLTPDSP